MNNQSGIDAVRHVGNKALENILSLEEQLETEKAARLAAETCLLQMSQAIDTALSAKDSWTGLKAVTCAMAQMRQLDLAAARETLRKAAEADTLRTERDGLLAMVEQQHAFIDEIKGIADISDGIAGFHLNGELFDWGRVDCMINVDDLLALTPTDALAKLREEIRREVLKSNWQPWPPNDKDTNECLAYRDDAGIFPAQCVYDEDTGEPTWFAYGGLADLTGELPTLWHPMPSMPLEGK